jgi:hypothetical protein
MNTNEMIERIDALYEETMAEEDGGMAELSLSALKGRLVANWTTFRDELRRLQDEVAQTTFERNQSREAFDEAMRLVRQQQSAIKTARALLHAVLEKWHSIDDMRYYADRALAALDEPASDAGDKVRFCPECFGVGEVAEGYYACCPEMRSFYIPKVAADAIEQMKPAYFAAIKASNAEAALDEPASDAGDGWISVTERLPEDFRLIIVFIPDACEKVSAAYYYPTCFSKGGISTIAGAATHWRPLPAAPRSNK